MMRSDDTISNICWLIIVQNRPWRDVDGTTSGGRWCPLDQRFLAGDEDLWKRFAISFSIFSDCGDQFHVGNHMMKIQGFPPERKIQSTIWRSFVRWQRGKSRRCWFTLPLDTDRSPTASCLSISIHDVVLLQPQPAAAKLRWHDHDSMVDIVVQGEVKPRT